MAASPPIKPSNIPTVTAADIFLPSLAWVSGAPKDKVIDLLMFNNKTIVEGLILVLYFYYIIDLL